MHGLTDRIELKTPEQIVLMRKAGLVVARALEEMSQAVQPGVSTGDLDEIARAVLSDAGATSSFLHYDIGSGPYPAVICASVNDRIVHGIPSPSEKLVDGDIISIDFGAIVDGWHGDAAVTVGVGEIDTAARDMSEACRESLWAGIAAARVGGRLTDISSAVETSIRASGRYGIVAGYGGHGIGTSMHMDPHILNYGRKGKGPRLTVGMALAIEPMVTLGGRGTQELSDGWTVSTADGSRAAHWEHTVALLDDGVWVLTATDGGRAELERRGVPMASLGA
jgi:methionyl aminopeptidase